MLKFSIILLLCSLLFCNFKCNECEDVLSDHSSYTANISPLNDRYSIGDTISIGTSFSPHIPLKNNKTTYDNSNKRISFVVQVFEVKPNNKQIIDGIEDFEILSNVGQISISPFYDNKLSRQISNLCDTDKCEFRIELIPMKNGIYCFSLLSSGFGEFQCEQLSLVQNDFGLNDNNFEICQEINTNSFRISDTGPFYQFPADNKSFYFFKVN